MDETEIIFSVFVILVGVCFAFFPREVSVLHRKFAEFTTNPQKDLAKTAEVESRLRTTYTIFRVAGIVLIVGTIIRVVVTLA